MAGLRRLLARARRSAGVRGTVGVRLVDDAAMRRLNRQFRGHDRATDVLSFPIRARGYLGDIAISLDAAERQAREQGHGREAELGVLLVHGLLHLAGYDHETDAGDMRLREQQLRQELGLPPGLLERH